MKHQPNYLVTGATGFMGPHLIQRLQARGQHCRCIVRNPAKADLAPSPTLEIVKADITKPETLSGIADGIDYVLHLATLGHMNNFTVNPHEFETVNVQGTENIMHAALAAGVSKIVHCSSVAAMGICPENPADETTACRPHHPYGQSKLMAEKRVQSLVATRGLPAVIVRFSMVYGPGDGRDMLKLARLTKKGLFPKIGNKPKLTPLIHVQDAINGLELALDHGRVGEIYLLTNAQSEPFDRLRHLMQQAMGIKRFPIYVPQWLALVLAGAAEKMWGLAGAPPPVTRKNIESTLSDRVFSIAKAQKELGFAPKIEPAAGIGQTIDWYRQHGWI